MNEKRRKQIQVLLFIVTIIVWIVFACLFLEGTWKEELEEQRNITSRHNINWENTTIPYFSHAPRPEGRGMKSLRD